MEGQGIAAAKLLKEERRLKVEEEAHVEQAWHDTEWKD